MAHLQLVKQTSSGLLLPATPESGDFLRSVKIGEWIHADFKRVRNYAFHKRFFKLLQLGFDYWMPTGGTVTSREQKLISGFVNFLCDSAGQEYTPALNEAAEQYLHNVATLRTGDVALLKSFDAFREWAGEVMTMDKHTTWLAYIWALISGICAQWTLNDYGALIGIVLGIGTFLVNKHYKKKSEQAQARQAAAMEERNRLIARILEKNDHDSTLKMLAVSEMPEGSNGAQDKS